MDYRFKILYVSGIILVVAGHCGNGGISFFNDWFPVSSFHLALFTFSSGYFYKNEAEMEPGQYILKKIKNLLIPLYLWNVFYALVNIILSFKGFTIGDEVTVYSLLVAPVIDGHQFSYNMGGWFVIPLFMVQVYNVLIRKLFGSFSIKCNEWLYFFINLSLGMAGVQLASQGYNTGWWLALVRMLYFIPFYSLGILYKKKLEKYDKKISSLAYFTTIFSVQLIIIYIFGKVPNYVPAWCNNFTDGSFMPFVAGTLGIAFWFRIARILEPAIGKNKYINLIANNTYSIMINQFMGFMMIKTIFGLINRLTNFCADFDKERYKSEIWYYYLPDNMKHFFIVYLAAGIVFPITVQLIINKGWEKIKKEFSVRQKV